ncbi:MAG: type II secretion system protein [Chthoniobacteraceae bacterium]
MKAFTLIELMTVIVIILILCTMAMPVYSIVVARMEKITCIQNLKSLYVASESYVQQYGHWPQISAKLSVSSPHEYAADWYKTLQPFGLSTKSFICPTVQKGMGNPDYNKVGSERTDYIATPFDSQKSTPHKWPTQPWFAERGDVHGSGNLLIMTDGSIHQLSEYKKK